MPYASAPFVLRAVIAHGETALRSVHAPDAACVHRIPPRARDDRDTPLMWDETAWSIAMIRISENQNIFSYGAGQPNHTRSSPSGSRILRIRRHFHRDGEREFDPCRANHRHRRSADSTENGRSVIASGGRVLAPLMMAGHAFSSNPPYRPRIEAAWTLRTRTTAISRIGAQCVYYCPSLHIEPGPRPSRLDHGSPFYARARPCVLPTPISAPCPPSATSRWVFARMSREH